MSLTSGCTIGHVTVASHLWTAIPQETWWTVRLERRWPAAGGCPVWETVRTRSQNTVMALDHLAQPRKIFGPTTVNPVPNDWLNLYGPITEDNRSTRGSLVCFLTFLLHFFNYITLFQPISSLETLVTLYHIHTLTSLTRSHFKRLNFHNKRSIFTAQDPKSQKKSLFQISKDLFWPPAPFATIGYQLVTNSLSLP